MRTLEVWLNDQLIGHIIENRKGARIASELVNDCLIDLEKGLEEAQLLYPDSAAKHEKHVRQRIAQLREVGSNYPHPNRPRAIC